jgi:hypothetical protein
MVLVKSEVKNKLFLSNLPRSMSKDALLNTLEDEVKGKGWMLALMCLLSQVVCNKNTHTHTHTHTRTRLNMMCTHTCTS